jgi:chromosome segregation ATPase
MTDIPIGWATLIASTVTSLGGIAAIIVSIVLSRRTRRDVKQVASDTREVKEQVKNSHTTNLREEGDERHAEVVGELKAIRRTQAKHSGQINELQSTQRGMKRDIGRLADADAEQVREDHRLGERITELEKTGPRKLGQNGAS